MTGVVPLEMMISSSWETSRPLQLILVHKKRITMAAAMHTARNIEKKNPSIEENLQHIKIITI